jgi:hypothetical protein
MAALSRLYFMKSKRGRIFESATRVFRKTGTRSIWHYPPQTAEGGHPTGSPALRNRCLRKCHRTGSACVADEISFSTSPATQNFVSPRQFHLEKDFPKKLNG